MILLIILSTFLFVFISFITSATANTSNPFLSYFLTEFYFLLSNFIVFAIGLITFVTFYILFKKFNGNYSLKKKITETSLNLFQIILLGFFLSYISLYLLAFLQLNILSVLININPKIIGVESDTNIIAEKLKSNSISPNVFLGDSSNNNALASVAQASTGYNNIYGKIILPSMPNIAIIPMYRLHSTFFLIDNTLIISKINNNDLQKISPIISYLFVKEYFGNKIVKSYPKIAIMDNQQYMKFRSEDAAKKIVKINEQLVKIGGTISTISAAIESDKLQISKNDIFQSKNDEEKNIEYDKCITHYEIAYCKTIISNKYKQTLPQNKDLEKWKDQLKFDEELLSVYTYYDKFFNAQKISLQNIQNVVPFEQGVFEPEDTIKSRLDTKNTHALGDFFSIVIHEYFHYASYTKGKKFASTFFEEGLTEYFSRQVVKHNLNITPNLGYPIQARIIEQISNRIAESELVNIYFSKNDKQFEDALDRVYGDGFYEKNRNIFEALMYASNPKQLVDLANKIMEQIGGEKLSEKDFFSSSSSL